MKKIVAALLIAITIFSLCGCSIKENKTVSVTSEVVEAIVTRAYLSGRWCDKAVVVEYNDVKETLLEDILYDTYKENVGSVVRLVLITHTYEDGSIKQDLVYNKNVFNGGELK